MYSERAPVVNDTTGSIQTAVIDGEAVIEVRPATTYEVARTIDDVRATGVPLTVRGGGHSIAGHSRADAGVLLDLSALDDITVVDDLVQVGGGATWGAVAAALTPYGLAITSGDTASVGVGGLTLGGGFGWMVRRYGLAIDSLIGAEIVTADGQVREVGPGDDLFWALRGGGGNVGVVTRFDFLAQPVPSVVRGTITYGATAGTADLIEGWRDHLRGSDERLSSTIVAVPAGPHGPATVMVQWCFAGDDEAAAGSAVAGLRGGQVVDDVTEVVPYAEMLEEHEMPPGMQVAMRSALMPRLTDEAIDDLVGLQEGQPTMLALRGLGGAYGRVAPEKTAFAHRDAEVLAMAARMAPPGAPEPTFGSEAWARASRHGSGPYVGFSSDAGPDEVAAAYPTPTYGRLARIKEAYDPANLFRRNHNVVPASAGAWRR